MVCDLFGKSVGDVRNESETREFLVLPLLRECWGGDVFPEAPVGGGRCVDYALCGDGGYEVVVEVKAVGSCLGSGERDQLMGYMRDCDCELGVLTNGEVFELYRGFECEVVEVGGCDSFLEVFRGFLEEGVVESEGGSGVEVECGEGVRDVVEEEFEVLSGLVPEYVARLLASQVASRFLGECVHVQVSAGRGFREHLGEVFACSESSVFVDVMNDRVLGDFDGVNRVVVYAPTFRDGLKEIEGLPFEPGFDGLPERVPVLFITSPKSEVFDEYESMESQVQFDRDFSFTANVCLEEREGAEVWLDSKVSLDGFGGGVVSYSEVDFEVGCDMMDGFELEGRGFSTSVKPLGKVFRSLSFCFSEDVSRGVIGKLVEQWWYDEVGELDAGMIESGITQSQRKQIQGIKELLSNMEAENDEYSTDGIPREKIYERGKEEFFTGEGCEGLDEEDKECFIGVRIDKLKRKGEIYEPSNGKFLVM